MITTISATELKNRLSEVLNQVYYNRVTFMVKKHGKPLVKIIPIEHSDKLIIK